MRESKKEYGMDIPQTHQFHDRENGFDRDHVKPPSDLTPTSLFNRACISTLYLLQSPHSIEGVMKSDLMQSGPGSDSTSINTTQNCLDIRPQKNSLYSLQSSLAVPFAPLSFSPSWLLADWDGHVLLPSICDTAYRARASVSREYSEPYTNQGDNSRIPFLRDVALENALSDVEHAQRR